MNRTPFIYILFALNFWFLVSCDTLPKVGSQLEWKSSQVDQKCIRAAIEATEGVEFESQLKQKSDAVCLAGDCPESIYTTFYKVLSNKKYRRAYVVFSKSISGKIELQNYGSGEFNTPLPDEERQGFKKAIVSLNQQIKKHCPNVGFVTSPK